MMTQKYVKWLVLQNSNEVYESEHLGKFLFLAKGLRRKELIISVKI